MFKFVVVCALIAAAVAEPQAVISSFGYPGGVVYDSPLVHPAAVTYSSPLAHFIKKRSVLVASPTLAYSAFSPLATAYSSPFITTAHLIKKRAAPLIWPSAYTPTIGAASYISPYFSSLPIAYGADLIKK